MKTIAISPMHLAVKRMGLMARSFDSVSYLRRILIDEKNNSTKTTFVGATTNPKRNTKKQVMERLAVECGSQEVPNKASGYCEDLQGLRMAKLGLFYLEDRECSFTACNVRHNGAI